MWDKMNDYRDEYKEKRHRSVLFLELNIHYDLSVALLNSSMPTSANSSLVQTLLE